MKTFKQYLQEVKLNLKPFDMTKNWKKNSDGSYDVDGDVDLSHQGLTKIPYKFNKVTGYFDCRSNELTSLEGAPKEVYGFICWGNKLTSLEGAPKFVGGYFYCKDNELTSLKGAPTHIDGNFNCSNNKLTSLKGAPKYVGGDFLCYDNSIQFTKDDVRKVSNVKYNIYT